MQLKNIRFKRYRATVLSIEHIQRVLLSWELQDTTQDLRHLSFIIERGESPQELKPISTFIPASELYEYVDYSGTLLSLMKIYYYRIKAFEVIGGTQVLVVETPAFGLDGNLDLVGLYIVEENLFEERWIDGVPCLIYKKMKEGTWCPVCWDSVLKRVTKSNCKTCAGTGRLGGYYKPIEAWVKLNPDNKDVSIPEWGEKETNQLDFMFTNYPALVVGDLFYECKPGKFFRLDKVTCAEKNRVATIQLGRLTEINRSDIEYSLEIPEDIVLKMVKDLEDRSLIREF